MAVKRIVKVKRPTALARKRVFVKQITTDSKGGRRVQQWQNIERWDGDSPFFNRDTAQLIQGKVKGNERDIRTFFSRLVKAYAYYRTGRAVYQIYAKRKRKKKRKIAVRYKQKGLKVFINIFGKKTERKLISRLIQAKFYSDKTDGLEELKRRLPIDSGLLHSSIDLKVLGNFNLLLSVHTDYVNAIRYSPKTVKGVSNRVSEAMLKYVKSVNFRRIKQSSMDEVKSFLRPLELRKERIRKKILAERRKARAKERKRLKDLEKIESINKGKEQTKDFINDQITETATQD